MNFIIPKNYKFKPKLLGILDYQTALLGRHLGWNIIHHYKILIPEFNN